MRLYRGIKFNKPSTNEYNPSRLEYPKYNTKNVYRDTCTPQNIAKQEYKRLDGINVVAELKNSELEFDGKGDAKGLLYNAHTITLNNDSKINSNDILKSHNRITIPKVQCKLKVSANVENNAHYQDCTIIYNNNALGNLTSVIVGSSLLLIVISYLTLLPIFKLEF